MNWLERELSWGVAIQEQRHLVGRIGELYAALMTGGQMALEVNQAGYDVVSSSDERISVKTTTQQGSAGHISFSPSTIDQVDRVMVFFLNTDEMQIDTLLDVSISEALKLFLGESSQGKLNLSLSKLRGSVRSQVRSIADQKVIAEESHKGFTIRELESGTIIVLREENIEPTAKPILRQIALELGVSILNSNGNPFTTRQLGTQVIKSLQTEAST